MKDEQYGDEEDDDIDNLDEDEKLRRQQIALDEANFAGHKAIEDNQAVEIADKKQGRLAVVGAQTQKQTG